MEMRDVPTEDQDVDQFRARLLLQRLRGPRQNGAQRPGLLSLQLRDVGYVSLRFQVGETRDLTVEARREPPSRILPDGNAVELGVAFLSTTDQAIRTNRWRLHHRTHLVLATVPGNIKSTVCRPADAAVAVSTPLKAADVVRAAIRGTPWRNCS